MEKRFVILTIVVVAVVVGLIMAHGLGLKERSPYDEEYLSEGIVEATLTVVEISPTKPLIIARNDEGKLFIVDVSSLLQWGLPQPKVDQTISVKGYLSDDFETLSLIFAQSITVDGKTYTANQQDFWHPYWAMPCHSEEWYGSWYGGHMMPGMMGW
ncbi:MAG: hypothetical protein PWP37_1739 [Thermotogota bacterium]|nr:hypothetical protein [Thermotogota bacterium]